MNTQKLEFKKLENQNQGFISVKDIMPNEVEGLSIEFVSIKGLKSFEINADPGIYEVLLSFKGLADIYLGLDKFYLSGKSIVRLPYNQSCSIEIKPDEEIHFLRFKKSLDGKDVKVIERELQNHSRIFIKALKECPTYTEDIKSSKTVSRMILPDGMVPRFCMGSVETEGPDNVAEHEHPMLDQLFFGLEGCKCTCIANGEEALLEENTMLHIPLGSKHSVSVAEGDKLAYVWLDFFLTLEGQKYMGEQHQVDE